MTTSIFLILGGLIVLVLGGELLVRGASRLAALAGVSPLIIGLTVVAFGTSAPELAVSVKASFGGQADIAVGNVVGSSIFNILFILGISAIISPLVVSSQLVRIDVPIMIIASIAAWLFSMDGYLSTLEGSILFLGLIGYLGWSIYQSQKENVYVQEEFNQEFSEQPKKTLAGICWEGCLIVVGLVFLTYGAQWLVTGSSNIARSLGMSELLIGLTIVAVGTSLPEVATSIMASVRGERDIAVGNVVGSNIFNVMSVMGLSAIVSPTGIAISESALRLDMPIMIAACIACLPIFYIGHRIERWDGIVFFGYYIAYTAYLILEATNSAVSRTLADIVVFFVIPLSALTLLIGVVRHWKANRVQANGEVK